MQMPELLEKIVQLKKKVKMKGIKVKKLEGTTSNLTFYEI
jgi:hypothetical protein